MKVLLDVVNHLKGEAINDKNLAAFDCLTGGIKLINKNYTLATRICTSEEYNNSLCELSKGI